MKIIPYKNKFNWERYQKATEMLSIEPEENYYQLQKSKLMQLLKFGNLENKIILDLGCGNIHEEKNFHPWLSRALYKNNIKVIGIDKHSLMDEPYEHYETDLTTPNSLKSITSSSVDIAIANMLFMGGGLEGNYENLKKNLTPELKRVLKKDGIFTYDYAIDKIFV